MNKKSSTFVDFALVVTVGDAVKHFLRISTVGVEFGAKSDAIRNDSSVFTRDRTSLFSINVDSCWKNK